MTPDAIRPPTAPRPVLGALLRTVLRPGVAHTLSPAMQAGYASESRLDGDVVMEVFASPGIMDALSGPETVSVLDAVGDFVDNDLIRTVARRTLARAAAEGRADPAPAFLASSWRALGEAVLDTRALDQATVVGLWQQTSRSRHAATGTQVRLLHQPAAPLGGWPELVRQLATSPGSATLYDLQVTPWPGAATTNGAALLQGLLGRPDVPLEGFDPVIARHRLYWLTDLVPNRLLGASVARLRELAVTQHLGPELPLIARQALLRHAGVTGIELLGRLDALLSSDPDLVAELMAERAGDLPNPDTPEAVAVWQHWLARGSRVVRLEAVRRFAAARGAERRAPTRGTPARPEARVGRSTAP